MRGLVVFKRTYSAWQYHAWPWRAWLGVLLFLPWLVACQQQVGQHPVHAEVVGLSIDAVFPEAPTEFERPYALFGTEAPLLFKQWTAVHQEMSFNLAYAPVPNHLDGHYVATELIRSMTLHRDQREQHWPIHIRQQLAQDVPEIGEEFLVAHQAAGRNMLVRAVVWLAGEDSGQELDSKVHGRAAKNVLVQAYVTGHDTAQFEQQARAFFETIQLQ